MRHLCHKDIWKLNNWFKVHAGWVCGNENIKLQHGLSFSLLDSQNIKKNTGNVHKKISLV